jgi:hypothetical protein
MVFENVLEVGTTVLVDLHDEVISFGENIGEIELLPHFWDFETSLEEGSFEVTVELGYDPDELLGLGMNEEDLTIYFYNEEIEVWEQVESLIGTSANTVSFITDHFSRYAIGVAEEETIEEIYDRLETTINESSLSRGEKRSLIVLLRSAERFGSKPGKLSQFLALGSLRVTELKIKNLERKGKLDTGTAESILNDLEKIRIVLLTS